MTYRTVAIVSAIVSLGYGLAALVVPDALASLYAISFDAAALYAGRLLGGAYVGYAIVDFLTRDTADQGTRRAVAAANAFAWAAGLVVSVFAELQGLANARGWATVLLQVVFTVAWAWVYVAQRQPDAESQRRPARSARP